MSELRFEASPLSKAKIAAVTEQFRAMFRFGDGYLPVPALLEGLLPLTMGDRYTFSVLEHAEMGSRHGYFDPSTGELALRSDVYNGVCAGNGRDRFTACHEVGHLILHGQGRLSRVVTSSKTEIFRDPEWQANEFASSLLMPSSGMKSCGSVEAVTEEFGVSFDAAVVRLKKLGLSLPQMNRAI